MKRLTNLPESLNVSTGAIKYFYRSDVGVTDSLYFNVGVIAMGWQVTIHRSPIVLLPLNINKL